MQGFQQWRVHRESGGFHLSVKVAITGAVGDKGGLHLSVKVAITGAVRVRDDALHAGSLGGTEANERVLYNDAPLGRHANLFAGEDWKRGIRFCRSQNTGLGFVTFRNSILFGGTTPDRSANAKV